MNEFYLFLVLSAVYMAPHLKARHGTFTSAVMLGLAGGVWIVRNVLGG